MGFSSRAGYEYSYVFSLMMGVGDEIIKSPSEEAGAQDHDVIFEIRTFFLLVRNSNEYEVLDAEKGMSVFLPAGEGDDPYGSFSHVSYRLDQYLMTEAEIQTLIQKALDFAAVAIKITALPPAAAIKIVIDINVCTVQLDGETVEEAIHRSVRPECLVPLDLVRPDVAAAKEDESYLRLREYLLFGLPRIRAEDLHTDGFGPLMDTCPICSCGPTAAAPVSMLPCRHAFHTHCIVRWLLESDSCPMCPHAATGEGGGGFQVKEEQLDWPGTQAQPTNHLPGGQAKKEEQLDWSIDHVKEEQIDRPVTQTQPTNHLSGQVKEEQLDWPVTQAQSTIHVRGPTRVRRAPARFRDYVVGGGVRVM